MAIGHFTSDIRYMHGRVSIQYLLTRLAFYRIFFEMGRTSAFASCDAHGHLLHSLGILLTAYRKSKITQLQALYNSILSKQEQCRHAGASAELPRKGFLPWISSTVIREGCNITAACISRAFAKSTTPFANMFGETKPCLAG
jgi:hypothetical protein